MNNLNLKPQTEKGIGWYCLTPVTILPEGEYEYRQEGPRHIYIPLTLNCLSKLGVEPNYPKNWIFSGFNPNIENNLTLLDFRHFVLTKAIEGIITKVPDIENSHKFVSLQSGLINKGNEALIKYFEKLVNVNQKTHYENELKAISIGMKEVDTPSGKVVVWNNDESVTLISHDGVYSQAFYDLAYYEKTGFTHFLGDPYDKDPRFTMLGLGGLCFETGRVIISYEHNCFTYLMEAFKTDSEFIIEHAWNKSALTILSFDTGTDILISPSLLNEIETTYTRLLVAINHLNTPSVSSPDTDLSELDTYCRHYEYWHNQAIEKLNPTLLLNYLVSLVDIIISLDLCSERTRLNTLNTIIKVMRELGLFILGLSSQQANP